MELGKAQKKCLAFVLSILGVVAMNGQQVAVQASSVDTLSLNTDALEVVFEDSVDTVIVKTELMIANERYAVYESKLNGGESSDDIYNALNECTTSYFNVLKDSTLVDSIQIAKERLLLLHPKMAEAGIYFSQRANLPKAVEMLEKYILLPRQDVFKDEVITLVPNYPSLVYFVAQNKFNSRNFGEAAILYDEYLESGNKDHEQNAYLSLGMAYGYIGQLDNKIYTLMKGLQKYPKDVRFTKEILEYHIKTGNVSQAQLHFMNYQKIASELDVLSMQARILAIAGKYMDSMLLSEKWYSADNNNINAIVAYGRASYNYVISEMNNGKQDANKMPLPELMPFLETAADMFTRATRKSNDKQYQNALINTYLLMNKRDEALAFAGRMGISMDLNENVVASVINEKHELKGQELNNTIYADAKKKESSKPLVTSAGVPFFSSFANDYVEKHLRPFFIKGTYEKTIDYEKRTSGESLKAEKRRLVNEAKKEYLRKYSGSVASRLGGITYQGYDPDNETALINYNLGNMVVNIPIDKAPVVANNWGFLKLANPKYDVSNDSIVLDELTFNLADAGISFTYSRSEQNRFQRNEYIVDNVLGENGLEDILGGGNNNQKNHGGSVVSTSTTRIGGNKKSDIDIGIPVLADSLRESGKYTFVLIINNEDYELADNVHYAIADGTTFREYCEKMFGIQGKNITHLRNAPYLRMKRGIELFVNKLREYGSQARGIVYYSGHGVPNYATQEAHILAIDGSPTSFEGAYQMKELYNQLATTGASRIDVFLDCCFSGKTKSGNAIFQGRATAIKPRDNVLNGNLTVFSACSSSETAFHYADEGHGLFTYFLLKKLKETAGDVTMGELFDFVHQNVRRTSLHNNDVYQTPNVQSSESMRLEWKTMKMR